VGVAKHKKLLTEKEKKLPLAQLLTLEEVGHHLVEERFVLSFQVVEAQVDQATMEVMEVMGVMELALLVVMILILVQQDHAFYPHS
jgi:hypothetical protein